MNLRLLATNTAANFFRGLTALGYNLLIPALLIRGLGSDQYAAWFIIFQASLYVSALDLGVQAAISRFTAAAAAGRGDGSLDTILGSALAAEGALGVVAAVVATGLVLVLHLVPDGISTRTTLLVAAIMCGVAGLSLVSSVFEGWLIGRNRSGVPALHLAVARIVAAVAAVASVGFGLVWVTVALTLPIALTTLTLGVSFVRQGGRVRRPSRDSTRHLVRYVAPLSVWSVAMVVIGGVDIFLVRAFAPSSTADYALALTAVNIVSGLIAAAATSWLPMATEHALDGGPRFARLVEASVTGTVRVLGILVVPLAGLADVFVRVWAGPGSWGTAIDVMHVLLVAQAVRLALQLFASALVATGDHRNVYLSPIAEAVVNLAFSLLLGSRYGAIGVAWGTLIGALVGSTIHIMWSTRKAPRVGLTPTRLFRASVVTPWDAVLGIVLVPIAVTLIDLPAVVRLVLVTAVILPSTRAVLPYMRTRRRRSAGVVDRDGSVDLKVESELALSPSAGLLAEPMAKVVVAEEPVDGLPEGVVVSHPGD